MSSTIRFINWQPQEITPNLNGFDLQNLNTSFPDENYYPASTQTQRDESQPPEPGVWGNTNSLMIRPVNGGSTQVYNDLTEPSDAAPNNELLLWIFPDFILFSQFEDQLGEPVYPD